MYKFIIYYKTGGNSESEKKGLTQADDIYSIFCVAYLYDCKKLLEGFMSSSSLIVCFMSFQVSGPVGEPKLSFILFHSNEK